MFSAVIKLREILTKRELFQLGCLLIAIITMALFQVLGIASILPFIGLVMDQSLVFDNHLLFRIYETLNFTSVRRFIIFAGVTIFVIIFLSNAISAFATWFKLKFAWTNNHRLSRRLLKKYLSMPYPFFLNQNSSDLSKNVLSEVNHLTLDYLIPLLTIITKSLMVILILIMLFWVDIIISFTALFLIGGAYGAIYWRVKRNLTTRGRLRLQTNKMRFKTVNEAFGGIKEIKVMKCEPYFIKRYSKESYKFARLMSWNAVIGQIPRFALEVIAFGSIILFVLVLLLTRDDVSQIIPLASLFAFAGYRLMPSLQDIFASITRMQFNRAVLDRIYSDLTSSEMNTPAETFSREEKSEALPFLREIKLDHISYCYPNTQIPVIKDINLIIKCNTAVAFVGPTGAGKTTLVDIILGLLIPQKGRLLVDGVQMDQSNIDKWQRNIGYVPQHIYLRDDTVARNIAFGVNDSDIDREALEHAARVANIHDFIVGELPKGYETFVGERGIRLSGGQRQRIGIARAIYYDPELMVFDEATSALDGITEEAVLQAMESTAQLKTLIVIAHRLTTVKNCDMVYMLDQGRIIDSGTYDELLGSNKKFKAMARLIK